MSLRSEFNVVFCVEVGMSLHVNSSNPSYIIEDFIGSHGLMLLAFSLSKQSYKAAFNQGAELTSTKINSKLESEKVIL